jgi:uroporphyrinogen decarboxylase
MNSRERTLAALNFQEPDRIPFDLAGTTWTGITNTAYQNLCDFLGMANSSPVWSDVIQQIVIPSEEMMARLKVDTRGVFPLTSHNWDVFSKCVDKGDYLEYRDEWNFVHHFPKMVFGFP